MNEKLFLKMIEYFEGDPKRIQHFTKVNSYCKLIGTMEAVDDSVLNVLDIVSLVHDIGIKKAEELFGKGNCGGKYQENLGPDIARNMLEELDYDSKTIDRVCYLIGHHHTYNDIDGIDYQILIEADFIVNLFEDEIDIKGIKIAMDKIFTTNAGKSILKKMYDI